MATPPRTTAQPDLFLAHVTDAAFRDQLDLMSVPVVSLAKGKRKEPIRFKRGDIEVEVSAPAHLGIATIWDMDVVLWAISQLNDAVNKGKTPPQTITAPVYDVLRAIKRGTSGRDYQELRAALERLTGTLVRTNLAIRKGSRHQSFHLLEGITWAEDELGRARGVAITVPGWLHKAVLDRRVLALDARYFEITSGHGRWLYRLARKQAGDNVAGWRWTMAELHERAGSTRAIRSFASDLRKLITANTIPEYWFSAYTNNDGAECVHAVRRSKLTMDHPGRETPLPRGGRNPTL